MTPKLQKGTNTMRNKHSLSDPPSACDGCGLRADAQYRRNEGKYIQFDEAASVWLYGNTRNVVPDREVKHMAGRFTFEQTRSAKLTICETGAFCKHCMKKLGAKKMLYAETQTKGEAL